MSKQRPFEKGDLVFSKKYGAGIVVSIKDNTGGIDFQSGEKKMIYSLESGVLAFSNFDVIKAIRQPRKGNAESRAIVAMLAREKRITLIDMSRHYTEEGREGAYWEKRKSDNNRWDCGRHYQKAKSMLK